MVAKRIALIVTSMILTGGMLITACAVYDSNSSKKIDKTEPVTNVSVSSAAYDIIETVVDAIGKVT